jgi:pyruvate dehydrogenase E2 component (dihydrolipoamide acetyltransferase)
MPDVAMPRLSDSMEEGTILKWLKADGDEVRAGEELVEIETDKANMTYEAEADGVVKIVAQEGTTLPVGEVIATIGEGSGGGQPADEPDEAQMEEGAAEEAAGGEGGGGETPSGEPEDAEDTSSNGRRDGAKVEAPAGSGERVKASPVARRMAREMGLSLGDLEGSGPGGRILKSDVESASREGGTPKTAPRKADPEERPAPAQPRPAQAPAPAPVAGGEGGTAKGEARVQELSRLQQVIARRMAESKATAPEFVLNAEVDMQEAVALRGRLKELAAEGETVPSFNDLVIRASALALRAFPRANGAYRDGRFELYSRVNVGMAVAAQDALIVPTIFDADRKSLGEIARDSRAVAERVRAGAVTPPELSGGTFTVSNLGMYGMTRITPVINPPQAAILGVGAMTARPVVVDGEITVRHRMDLTLVCDHRILYGADAAEFLGRIRELLEQPLKLAL